MDDRTGRTLHRFKGLLDDMLSRLRQYLYGHILRDHIVVDQRPHKLIFCLAGGRESHLDLLETDFQK